AAAVVRRCLGPRPTVALVLLACRWHIKPHKSAVFVSLVFPCPVCLVLLWSWHCLRNHSQPTMPSIQSPGPAGAQFTMTPCPDLTGTKPSGLALVDQNWMPASPYGASPVAMQAFQSTMAPVDPAVLASLGQSMFMPEAAKPKPALPAQIQAQIQAQVKAKLAQAQAHARAQVQAQVQAQTQLDAVQKKYSLYNERLRQLQEQHAALETKIAHAQQQENNERVLLHKLERVDKRDVEAAHSDSTADDTDSSRDTAAASSNATSPGTEPLKPRAAPSQAALGHYQAGIIAWLQQPENKATRDFVMSRPNSEREGILYQLVLERYAKDQACARPAKRASVAPPPAQKRQRTAAPVPVVTTESITDQLGDFSGRLSPFLAPGGLFPDALDAFTPADSLLTQPAVDSIGIALRDIEPPSAFCDFDSFLC
ncbi:uncharacterized protein V1510DRAFT_432593, partial [Dipodascopsis tothii]|uniref:uncharacterized protein n=1 Tax=Dipodascopsis tothii TaxID=44089 RepID=UPI0034CEFEEC